MKYNAQIGELTGTDGLEATYDAYCTEGAKAIINLMPPSILEQISTVSTFTLNLDIDGKRILNVMRNDGSYDRPCRKISSGLRGNAEDSGDMNYALASDPVYYVESEKIYIKPEPGTDKGICNYATYPTIDASGTDVGSLDKFPDEYEHLIVLYASIKELQKQMYDMKSSLPTHSQNNVDSYTEITASDNGWRAVRYYIETEEDVELSQASVQALTSEMQQYIARYQWLQGQQAKLQQEYDQGIQAMMARG